MDFDYNTPPPMPLSASLYCPSWMRQVRMHEPWMVFPIFRDAKRDAGWCMSWVGFALALWYATLWWHEMNVSPIRVQPVGSYQARG